jgi:fructan beta-fructosidase
MRILSLYLLVTLLGSHSAIGQKTIYQEPHRPQFHFSPPAKWMNDPNGMVYYKGEYHLFYQHYPDSTVWGPMHWGHAISKDMIHWQHQPIALYPDTHGDIFSGSVVVDEKNTSGFKQGAEAPLVAIFTYHYMPGEKAGRKDFQTQGIAYSTDKGRTWTKYANNPVIKNPGIKDFRDPKVIWHAASQQWVLTMAAGDEILFYHSSDLKNWELTGRFGKEEGSHGGVWECPDLFELTTKEGKSKWVLLVSIGTGAPNGGSGTQYFIGSFNGKTFTNENSKETKLWLDNGTDNYAGVTWYNAPNQRRLFLGWMSNWQYAQSVPTQKWRSAMTLPRELSLQESSKGFRLQTKPVAETVTLRTRQNPVTVTAGKAYPLSLAELTLQFDLSTAGNNDLGIELRNKENESVRIGYDPTNNQFYINRTQLQNTGFSKDFAAVHTAPRTATGKQLTMHLFIDKSSVELFADDGSVVMTDIFFPISEFNSVKIFQDPGAKALQNGKLYPLKSIW